MRRRLVAITVLISLSGAAHADCQSGVAAAMRRALALPPSAGRAALLEQIQRADVARHEDDIDGCKDELETATNVLDEIDAAKKRAAAAAPAQRAPATDASKP